MRDTLDNKIDVSHYLSDLHGFIPIPAIITEPSLGNFGLALAPVFLTPQKNKGNKDRFHFPDITALFGLYTANKTWALGAFRFGSIPKWGMRYRVGGMFGVINMNFYRTLPVVGEQKFDFSFNLKGLFLEVSENIFRNRVFLGTNYLFANSKISYEALVLPPDYFDEEDLKSNIGNLGFFLDVDYRNSIFTADKGVRVKSTYAINRDFTGSDYDFDRVELFTHVFLMPLKKWVSAFRAEAVAINDGAPFYAYPFIVMRGIPLLRYQGKQVLTFETEQRFDVSFRWSLVGFVGTGKAFETTKFQEQEDKWHWSGGLGFRYLASRLFKLRMGIDVARGPEAFAYYIVFGHSWNR